MSTPSVTAILRSSELTRRRLAPNPGPMSLDGTNSYLIGAPDIAQPGGAGYASCVVVDPGPLDEQHLQELAAAGTVELILITHRHTDHTAGAARLHELTGAPVRAADPRHCHGGPVLEDNETIRGAGVVIRVLATPGHTSDSVCFHLPDDGTAGTVNPAGSVLTGDTILGRGTTMLDFPDGTLGDYLASLDRLERLGPATVLPAHGPVLPALDEVTRAYREHRQDRLTQIRAALGALGRDAGVQAVTDAVYADIDRAVRPAAEISVAAQLDYLQTEYDRR
ncbi:MBL fold metallo-hydrolase [Pseudarthrobacter sp. N5]|uniref:MBL fold metallo-hydrolase n=1 Tax=Pseudarthrobacter sp. N5 TaxID=3418416 RepID=UPI003CEF99D3